MAVDDFTYPTTLLSTDVPLEIGMLILQVDDKGRRSIYRADQAFVEYWTHMLSTAKIPQPMVRQDGNYGYWENSLSYIYPPGNNVTASSKASPVYRLIIRPVIAVNHS